MDDLEEDNLVGHHNSELWEELRNNKRLKASFFDKSAPMSLVGSSIPSTTNELAHKGTWERDSNTLATLPSYLGQREDNSAILPLPFPNQN